MQHPSALLRVHGDPTIAIDPLAVGRIVAEIHPEALGVVPGAGPDKIRSIVKHRLDDLAAFAKAMIAADPAA